MPDEVSGNIVYAANYTSSVSFVLSLPLGLHNHRAGSLALPALVSQASSASLYPPQVARSFGTQGEAFWKASLMRLRSRSTACGSSTSLHPPKFYADVGAIINRPPSSGYRQAGGMHVLLVIILFRHSCLSLKKSIPFRKRLAHSHYPFAS